ncbi:DUF4131 domain-containing protein [Candidatus Peregrinibacteria bacterium]|jgi:competence protein ComEC|nr:DUF4131 domain-containing protein [Candidatus Peregrinibacteria bacterium]MBT3599157.1 DUF4131 domain-containing protein [Candidatus Peregrinibacteria bacterium]MBT4586181.1 DUF4131 domain-containing protein [Candidatus Peregrinibacteria bacterium]MBT6730797.1 DUF4131 domain-containing protein [Candidatus Peregrinibacteria bacterium]MBT7008871.1 DUF4131 domain-containing protein [Candidatus Peregrinibacteria bacterium]
MHKYRCVITFLTSFILYSFFLQWESLHQMLWVLIFIWILVSVLSFFIYKKAGALILFATVGCSVAIVNVHRSEYVPSGINIDTYANEQKITVYGEIDKEPDKRPMQTKYTIRVEQIKTSSGEIISNVEGLILATDHNGYPEYHYGDKVRAYGKLEKPGEIEGFKYDKYLSRFGITAVIYRTSIDIEEKTKWSVMGTLFNIKNRFESQINRIYPEPHASFMAGLLTGSRRGIPAHLMEDFNATGLTHIIAISGYNITIVITVISGLLFWLPLRHRFLPSIIAIALFTLFVGASAAVVRASIMGILGLLALQTGRQSNVRITILWTLFAMVLWNPKSLWYDAGFQLSFLAVIGLTELSPLIEKWFIKIPSVLGIREALQMTISAQISAVPLLILLFGRLSISAPLANLLVAPFIPLAMIFGFVGTILSSIWFFGGQLFAYIGFGCLEWIILVAKTLASIPFSTINIPFMSPLIILVYYVFLVMWIWIKRVNN